MPLTIKQGTMRIKNDDEYIGIDTVAETTTQQQVAAIQAAGTTNVGNVNTAGSTQVAAIEAKGVETRASIPDDYTELSDSVADLKGAIDDTVDIIGTGVEETITHTGGDTKSFNIPLVTGIKYTFQNNISNSITINARKADSTSVQIINSLASNKSADYIPEEDFVQIYFYSANSGTVSITSDSLIQKVNGGLNEKTDKTTFNDFAGEVVYGINKQFVHSGGDTYSFEFNFKLGKTYSIKNGTNAAITIYVLEEDGTTWTKIVENLASNATFTFKPQEDYTSFKFYSSAGGTVTITSDSDIEILTKRITADEGNVKNKANVAIFSEEYLQQELKTVQGGKRLNADGTLVNYGSSSYNTSRYLNVNYGDLIVINGVYNGAMIPVAGYSDRDTSTVTELYDGSAQKSTERQIITYKIKNTATRYILVCSAEGGSADFAVNCKTYIYPMDGYTNDLIVRDFANRFPNALSKANRFVSKVLNGDDVTICLLGDSITEFTNQTKNVNPSALPPCMERKNWCYHLWNNMNKNADMIARRSDYPDFFTFGGTFTTPTDADNSFTWNTVKSNDANAYFSFGWDLSEYEKTNIVTAITSEQATTITISVLSSGVATNNLVEIYIPSSDEWVEANAHNITNLRLSGADGNKLGGYCLRYKMRRKSGATGDIQIKVQNTTGSDYLVFWGVEQWNGQGVFIENAAYGGYATYELEDGNISNVKMRYPDLVLFELPLINNFDDRYQLSDSKGTLMNDFQDYIWGDRSGNTNALSLKNISNDWEDFEVVAIIPHWRKQYMNGNLFRRTINSHAVTYTALECWNAVKSLFVTHDDISVIDMSAAIKWEAEKRGYTLEQCYDGDAANDMKSVKKFCQDTVHLNDLGSLIYGVYISACFDNLVQ